MIFWDRIRIVSSQWDTGEMSSFIDMGQCFIINIENYLLEYCSENKRKSSCNLIVTNLHISIILLSQNSKKRQTLIGNEFADHSDVIGALPVGSAPTASSFLT